MRHNLNVAVKTIGTWAIHWLSIADLDTGEVTGQKLFQICQCCHKFHCYADTEQELEQKQAEHRKRCTIDNPSIEETPDELKLTRKDRELLQELKVRA